jgi:hypothetical protein
MEKLAFGDLVIDVDAGGDQAEGSAPIRLTWKGKSTDRHPAKVLTPYLSSALSFAESKKRPLELRFEKLDHFNSSTVATIIQLVQEARQKSVKLAFVFDPALKWQRLSFDALRVFVKADGLLEMIHAS